MTHGLVVVAPGAWHRMLRVGLATAGWRVRCVTRPRARPRDADRYSLNRIAHRWQGRTRALLLVAPRRVSPERACPGPVVGGVPVGCCFADRPSQLAAWMTSLPSAMPDADWAVLASWNGHHVPLALDMGRRLRRSGHAVRRWTADLLDRNGLCRGLASGPSLAAYTGHGASRGLSGFGGVGAADVSANPLTRPCGTFAAFACRTLARADDGRQAFGEQLVARGRVLCYLGATGDVDQQLNSTFARRCADLVAGGAPSIGDGLARLDGDLPPRHRLRGVLRAYRLVGLPIQPLA